MFNVLKRAAVAAVIAGGISGVQVANAASLLTNGGFETGDFTGWSATSDTSVITCAGFAAGCATGGGTYAALLNGSDGLGSASITQAVNVTGPGTYAFGAYVSYGTNVAPGNFAQGQVSLTVQGTTVSETLGGDPNGLGAGAFVNSGFGLDFTNWFLLSGILNYAGVGPASLLININVQNSSTSGQQLMLAADNAYIQAIPVPAGAWLLLSALGGLGFAGWRRRKAVAA